MSKNISLESEYQQLLRDLKSVVESLLLSQVANVWNVYGGLNRLHNVVENIFKHQFKVVNQNGDLDCWTFIQGLGWLQPDISSSTLSVDIEYQPHLPTHLKTDKVSLWLYRSLENHTLSQKLSWLLSDKEHLLTCYCENAFMLQEKYTEATLICLRAVESNDPSLLSEINPCLFFSNLIAKDFYKTHRRCSSFPEAAHYSKWNILPKKLSSENIVERETDIDLVKNVTVENKINIKNVCGKLKPWRSLPSLATKEVQIRRRSYTMIKSCSTTNSPYHLSPTFTKEDKLSPSILHINYSELTDLHPDKHRKNKTATQATGNRDEPHILSGAYLSRKLPDDTNSIEINRVVRSKEDSPVASMVRSAPDYSFSVLPGEKDYSKRPKKSFIEDGGNSVLPMSTGYFPRPAKGQTLTSFLSSSQFARTNAELDRENAHFSISEAMIAVIEQIKWKRELKIDEDQVESDEEINNLKQRIRLRRRQKQEEKHRKLWGVGSTTERDIDASTSATSAGGSGSRSDSASHSDSASDDGVDDLQLSEPATLLEQRGLSMSMASLYSDADLLRRPRGAPDGQADLVLSAEGVALSLISRFNEKQLPRASDLEWLVSEQDAPQRLLPLPKSWPVNPEEYTPLRGTAEWAPPRPQVIFTVHPSPVRKTLMARQKLRCAGCGMKVEPQYASRFRYCDYLGKYFCTGCHTNQLALIPGKVLRKWDFNRYPVSSFSYRLLDQMYNDPLFRVVELNPMLFRKSRYLGRCQTFRLQLFYLKDFILHCRFADMQQELLGKETDYLITEPEMYSLHDLVQAKCGDLHGRLKQLVDVCAKHVVGCELCGARAFNCEICRRGDALYPWQLERVSRCAQCGSCYHSACWQSLARHCSKCARIKARNSLT